MMKIIKYTLKNNKYELLLDDNSKLILYADTILKYELLLKKEIDKKELKEIILFNNMLEAYNIALKYISSKLRTIKEIKKKLINYDKETIDYVIERLKKENYLNDELYIKSYINDEINLKITGPNKILFDLKKLDFNDSDINKYLNTIDESIWLEKINNYILKKIKTNRSSSVIFLKQKIIKDLTSKGFYKEDIINCLNDFTFIDNEDIYNKEYNKIKNKLSKKYSGEELEFKVKMNLKSKGFDI